MSIEDVFIAIGFIVFCLAIIYYFGQCMSFQTSIIEGLENAEKPDAVTPKTPAGGVGANAAQYAENIKAITVKIQDELLIDKYKTDYEKVILATDDLIDNLMLKTLLSMKPDSPGQTLQSLSVMKNSKDALNDVMKFVDKGGSSATSSLGF
jgi:hypothetical protein